MFTPAEYRPLVVALTASVFAACGSATVGAVGMPPATAKWVGPAVPSPDGGRVTTTIYYGPWQCNASQLGRCQRQCASEGRVLMGCIWLADIKGDWVGRFMFLPAEGGTRYPLTHCCCDYATVNPRRGRGIWDNARDAFRANWIESSAHGPARPAATGRATTFATSDTEGTPPTRATFCPCRTLSTRSSTTPIRSATRAAVGGPPPGSTSPTVTSP